MDQDTCKVIYLDKRAPKAGSFSSESPLKAPSGCPASSEADDATADQSEVIRNVESLVSVFQKGNQDHRRKP